MIEEAIDYGIRAHNAAEAHLLACAQFLDLEEDGRDPDWSSIGVDFPYCGCQTCQVRETLRVAWPIMEEAVRAGVTFEPVKCDG